jgi:hypothetical protein
MEAEGEQVGVLEGFFDSQSLMSVHPQTAPHETQSILLNFAQIAHFDGIRTFHLGQLYLCELGVVSKAELLVGSEVAH